MYRSSPFRSNLSSKKSPNAKTRPRQKGPKPRKGCVSGSANVPVCGYIYIYTHLNWLYTTNLQPAPPPKQKNHLFPQKRPPPFPPVGRCFSPYQLLETTHPNSPWARKLNQTIVKFRVASPKDSFSYLMFGCFRGVEIPLRRPYPYCIS